MNEDKLKHPVNINYNNLPHSVGGMKNGERWYTVKDTDEIIEWAKEQIPDLPADVCIVANISGRMMSPISMCVAFALQPQVDEIQCSGTNFETMIPWKREG